MIKPSSLSISSQNKMLSLAFAGELDLLQLSRYEKRLAQLSLADHEGVVLELSGLGFIDTAAALYLEKLQKELRAKGVSVSLQGASSEVEATLQLVRNVKKAHQEEPSLEQKSFLAKTGEYVVAHLNGINSFFSFLGVVFSTKYNTVKSLRAMRLKEIAFEINETAIKALLIVFVTSFLMGVVVSYQSAYQLKLYGANIFIVDMLGLSILRELSPLITAIVIAGRSGSAFAAQIGAMKITEELDAMRTMGFDPYVFLVIPRILALMIVMPLLIFVSDMAALLGGMIIANIDLGISVELFLDRFANVIALKHFVVGVVKGPFFAFLIATIGIYRGMMVQNDTQSIGFNTTRSVVESIFAVIVCDAVFSVAFTNLGI
jgi:phospholipid/cholesterol/gamma-HCH transport system permease protein